jgi:hypothetical protein
MLPFEVLTNLFQSLSRWTTTKLYSPSSMFSPMCTTEYLNSWALPPFRIHRNIWWVPWDFFLPSQEYPTSFLVNKSRSLVPIRVIQSMDFQVPIRITTRPLDQIWRRWAEAYGASQMLRMFRRVWWTFLLPHRGQTHSGKWCWRSMENSRFFE